MYRWSIENIPDYWAAMWQFANIVESHPYDTVVDDLRVFPGTKWFVGARLNFAENLLRHRDEQVAFSFVGESQKTARITYAELYTQVARLARSLREIGVKPGDHVGSYMPNMIETAVAMLATTSIGAIWAACGVELGPTAVIDRFSQIQPKVLFTVDGYFYKGKDINTLQNAQKVVAEIPSIEKAVAVQYIERGPSLRNIPRFACYEEFLSPDKEPAPQFEQLAFDHPVYIMFSSGTTGKPKLMVQGVGVLLAHLKDLLLHTDLKREDKITYITTPSWMMWTWLISSLAIGATIVLYDGSPNYPDWGTMWRLVQDERISIFGCSASYVNYLRTVGAKPGTAFNLSSLREVSQTGSPLSAEGFEWIYREIKEDLHFNSITGGTDINSLFAAGSPTLPVYAGQIGAPSLGMKISAYDDNGNPVLDQEAELVCEAPSPSMPLYFLNDTNYERYKEAYFNFYKPKGKNVWRHGDYIIMHSDTGGMTFLGRSDSVLKPSGVRIGTAEIYNIVEKLPEITDSLVIGQNRKEDERVILFVQLATGCSLTEELKGKIRRALRENASPRHVPDLILEAPSIPYTFNMKKVESAVKNIVNGRPVTNRGALLNPESLEYFERILPRLQE